MLDLEILIGQVLAKVQQIGDKEIQFETIDGKRYKLYHEQDCCESVTIESIVGDLADLVGEPILMAEEATSERDPADNASKSSIYRDSFTWTFYKFATRKGYVDIRWYGESNGYYSERVDFSIDN